MKTSIRLVLSLLLAATSFAASAPTPGGSTAVALNPSNAFSFLRTNASGYLFLAAATPLVNPRTPGGSVGIALNPSNEFDFLRTDADGNLLVVGLPSPTDPVSTANGGLGANNSATSGVPLFTSGVVTFLSTNGTGNLLRSAGTAAIASGKTFTASNSLTLAGTDGSTLNVGTGGTLGTNAYTSTAYVPTTTTVNGNALSGNVTVTDSQLGAGTGLPVATLAHKASDALAINPVVVYVKSLTVRTAGGTSDIGSISVPAGITRFAIRGNINGSAQGTIVAETAAGTLAAATFFFYDGANGTGNQLTSQCSGPAATTTGESIFATSPPPISTGSTIYVRQFNNSANAGTCSFYILLIPLP